MKFNPITRRMFLRGTSGALLLPLLPSLLPREARAAAPTKALRFAMFTAIYGCPGSQFYPSKDKLGTLTVTPEGFRTKKLSAISGPISPVISSAFDNHRNRMSVIRGLAVTAEATLTHNGSFPSCGSGPIKRGADRSAPVFPYSIDTIMSQSSKIYPSTVGVERHVNISGVNFSWTNVAGKTQRMPAITDTTALMSRFSAVVGTPSDTTGSKRQQDVVQAVYDDYKRVRDNDKISSGDKQRLEAYMNLIHETQQGLAAGPVQCTDPTLELEPSADRMAYVRNRLNILVAMYACGLTRVGAFGIGGGDGGGSGNVHEDSHDNKTTVMGAYHNANAVNIAYFMDRMADIPDVDGSLLDNTLLMWGNEYGETLYRSPHQALDQNVVIAGGAGGRLRMGEYIDFATGTPAPPDNRGNARIGLQRRPYNNYMVTLFNAMGLASADYERDGLAGFGEYDPARITDYGLNTWTDTPAARRKALPYLYTGPDMG
jgi:hypothetical protein